MGVVAAIVGSALIGAASTAYKVNEQKKAAKKQERRIDRKEAAAKRQARVEAENQAALSEREETGAEVDLGREEDTPSSVAKAGGGGGTSRRGAVKSRVGGLKKSVMPKANSSSRIGL